MDQATRNDNLWLAMIALAGQDPPAAEEVIEVLRRNWPDLEDVAISRSDPQLASYTIGESFAAVAHLPAPIPWEQLEGPCEVAWYWPQASSSLRSHDSHLLVTLLDEGRDLVEKSTRLTQITAATARAAAAPAGVFWGPGRLVHNPADFAQAAAQMTRERLPLYLWIDFRVAPQDDGTHGLFTTGMEAFGYRELEVHRHAGSPQELVEKVFNIAHYILDGVSKVKDGDTIGLGSGVQATARLEPSLCDPALEAMRLDFNSGDALS